MKNRHKHTKKLDPPSLTSSTGIVQYSSDNKYLWYCTKDNTIYRESLKTGKTNKLAQLDKKIINLLLTEDNSKLLVGVSNTSFIDSTLLLDSSNGSTLAEKDWNISTYTDLKNNKLAFIKDFTDVCIVDINTDKMKTIPDIEEELHCVKLSPNAKCVYTGGADNKLKKWNVEDDHMLFDLEIPLLGDDKIGSHGILEITISNDEDVLLIGCSNGTIHKYNQKLEPDMDFHVDNYDCLSHIPISPNKQEFLYRTNEYKLSVNELNGTSIVPNLESYNVYFTDIKYSNDGTKIRGIDRHGHLVEWKGNQFRNHEITK